MLGLPDRLRSKMLPVSIKFLNHLLMLLVCGGSCPNSFLNLRCTAVGVFNSLYQRTLCAFCWMVNIFHNLLQTYSLLLYQRWSPRGRPWPRGDRLKNFCADLFFFFLESTRACVLGPWPWPRAFLSLASSIPVLGLESVCPRKGCPWPWPRIFFVFLALASSLVSSTPPLSFIKNDLFVLTLTIK